MTKLSEDILRLKAEGKTYNEIKAELGCSKGTISYHLGAGQKDKSLARTNYRRSRARAYIQEYKNSRPCVDCGESYPYWIMEFDHLDPKLKLFGVSRFPTKGDSLELVKSEIDKCELVCSNCHKNRTHMRKLEGMSDEIDKLHEVWHG